MVAPIEALFILLCVAFEGLHGSQAHTGIWLVDNRFFKIAFIRNFCMGLWVCSHVQENLHE